jgi:hypothetical protein
MDLVLIGLKRHTKDFDSYILTNIGDMFGVSIEVDQWHTLNTKHPWFCFVQFRHVCILNET